MTRDTDSESDVSISQETARTALREIEAAIERTGGPDVGADEACSPLAAVRQEVVESDIDDYARGFVLAAIDTVADERGVDPTGDDPLVDSTFQAKHELEDALDPDDDDEAQTVLTDGGFPGNQFPDRRVGPDIPPTKSGQILDSVESETPDTLLVCTECSLYYEYTDDWAHCPVCGEGLLEVDEG